MRTRQGRELAQIRPVLGPRRGERPKRGHDHGGRKKTRPSPFNAKAKMRKKIARECPRRGERKTAKAIGRGNFVLNREERAIARFLQCYRDDSLGREAGYCRPSFVVLVALASDANAPGLMLSTKVWPTPHISAMARAREEAKGHDRLAKGEDHPIARGREERAPSDNF